MWVGGERCGLEFKGPKEKNGAGLTAAARAAFLSLIARAISRCRRAEFSEPPPPVGGLGRREGEAPGEARDGPPILVGKDVARCCSCR